MASELVKPGDSMPNKFTKPGTPCSAGPWIKKSADASEGPLILGLMPAYPGNKAPSAKPGQYMRTSA
jgi:hypothetical protein